MLGWRLELADSFFCSQCIYTFHCRLAWNGPGIVASETFTFGAKSHLHSQLVIVAENVSLVTGKTRSWHVNIDRWSSMIIIGVTLVKICQSLVQKININQSPWWYTYTWSVGRCFARQYEAYSSHICQLKIKKKKLFKSQETKIPVVNYSN